MAEHLLELLGMTTFMKVLHGTLCMGLMVMMFCSRVNVGLDVI